MILQGTCLLLLFSLKIEGNNAQEQPVCSPDDVECSSSDSSETSGYYSRLQRDVEPEAPCGLWLAPTMLGNGYMGIYAGVDMDVNTLLATPDIHIPIYDANQNEHSAWHDLSWVSQGDVMLQNHFQSRSFRPGVGTNTLCNEEFRNIGPIHDEEVDTTGVHRSTDPSCWK